MAELPPAPRSSIFRDVPWGWGDVLVGVAPLALVRAVPLVFNPASLSGAPRLTWVFLTVLTMSWMFLYPLRIARRHTGLPRLPHPRVILVEALIAVAVLAVLWVMMGLVVLALTRLSGGSEIPPSPLEPLARSSDRIEARALMILAVLVAPFAEEVFFRGMLYNSLRQRLPRVVAALLQAAAFGLLHPFDLIHATAVALAGFAFALVYEWRKTLLAPILMHALMNAVGMAILAAGAAAYADSPMLGLGGTAHEGGCLVTKLAPGGAAEAAGLRLGDVVATVDGEPVEDTEGIARIVRRRRPGDRISVDFVRGGKPHRAEVTLQRRGG